MSWYQYRPDHIAVQYLHSYPFFLSPEFIGAFSGAFFAFLFGIISYRIIKRFERFVQHRNALISLDRLLNEHIDLIGLNRTGALNTSPILRVHKLTRNRLIELPIRNNLNMELGSLDIANRYFSYERGVHRTNVDSQSLNYTLTRFEDVIIGGGVLPGENWFYIVGAIDQVPRHLDKLETETKELLGLVRIHIRRLVNKGIWYANTNKNWDIAVTERELTDEVVALEQEIKESANKSPSITG